MGVIRFLGQHKGAVALVMLLLLLKAGCELAIPVLTSQIVDVGIAQSGVEDLDVLAGYKAAGVDLFPIQMAYLLRIGGLMLLAAAGSMVLDVAAGFVSARTGAKIGRDLRRRLFARVVAFSDAEINQFSAASLITRGTNDVTLIQNVCTMVMRMVLYAPILAIGGVVMVMVTNPQLGWIVVLAVAMVFAAIAVLFRFTLPRFKIMQTLIDRVNLVAREMLNGLSVVRAFNREGFEENRFDAASRKLRDTQLFTNRAMAFMMPTMMLVMNLTSVAIVWFGAQGVARGHHADRRSHRVHHLRHGHHHGLPHHGDGVHHAAPRRRGRPAPERGARDPSPPSATRGARLACDPMPQRARASLSTTSPSATPTTAIQALSHVSFTAEPGTTLAIVGPTGSGKSTIVKLIERFYDPTEGSVTLDGADLRALSQADLRACFGYVPQKAFLFEGTVESNIAYGDESADEAAIRGALEVACALDFVEAREGGLSAPIAQGGDNVSGGQRQRLSMARALVRRPRAYLFDDCFSALDYATDARVRAALPAWAAGSTVIIVAQRISTVLAADRIVVLDEGRVAGVGTHAELMESCPEYREIALSQLSEEELVEGGAR